MFNDKGDSGDWGASRAATRKTRTCTSNRLYTIFSSINNRPKNIGYACLLINFMMIVRYSMFNVRVVSLAIYFVGLEQTNWELVFGMAWYGMASLSLAALFLYSLALFPFELSEESIICCSHSECSSTHR